MFYKKYIDLMRLNKVLPGLQVDLQLTPSNNKLFSQTICPFSGATGFSQSAIEKFSLYFKQFLLKNSSE